jgi:hypothetical protein
MQTYEAAEMITDPGRSIKTRIGIETGPDNSVAYRRLELECRNASSSMSSARC